MSIKLSEQTRRPVNPCLDFVDETAYVTVPHSTTSGKSQYTDYVVTSDPTIFALPQGKQAADWDKRRLFPISKPHLVKEGLVGRWSAESIDAFVEGKAKLDPRMMYDNLIQELKKYVALSSPEEYEIFALWILSTGFRPLFDHCGLLYFSGPPESGKSQALKFISNTAFNGRHLTQASMASIRRSMSDASGTFCLDEMEMLGDPRADSQLLSLLLGCFDNGRAQLCSKSGEDYDVQILQTACPVAMANTVGIWSEPLKTRTININMRYCADLKNVKMPKPDDPVWGKLRDLIYLFIMLYWKEVRANYGHGTGIVELSSRENDCYDPLKAVADTIDPSIFENLRPYIIRKKKQKLLDKLANDINLSVLLFLKEKIEEKGVAGYSNSDLCSDFNFNTGAKLSAKRFVMIVRTFGVTSNLRNTGGSLKYDLVAEEIDKAIELQTSKS